MSLPQLKRWHEYALLEPFGEEIEDLRFASLMALTANLNRAKKSDKVWSPADFMPRWRQTSMKANIQKPAMDTGAFRKFTSSLRLSLITQASPRKRRVAHPDP